MKRIVPAVAASLLLLGAAAVLHLWILRQARQAISDEVARQSGGKYVLELGPTSFSYRSLTLLIEESTLEIYDSLHRKELAGLEVPQISLRFRSLVRYLLQHELLLDTVTCRMPSLTLQSAASDKDLTLSESLGRAALSLRQTADRLHIGFLRIKEGRLIIRPSRADHYSVRISDLNVDVKNFSVDSTADFRLLYTDDIRLQSGNQRIVFADSLNVISFQEIGLSTQTGEVLLDSCTIEGYRPNEIRSSYSFFFHQIRIADIDYGSLYSHNLIRADSLICYNPVLRLRIEASSSSRGILSDRMTEQTVKALLGNLDIKYVSLRNVHFDLVTQWGAIKESYTTRGNNVRLFGLHVEQGNTSPVQIERVAFEFANYRRLSPDSLYRESFDSILITNRDLVLINYRFVPSEFHRGTRKRWIQVPMLTLQNISLSTLLFERRVQATTADMRNPFIRISGGQSGHVVTDEMLTSFDTLRKAVGVERATIRGGRLVVDVQGTETSSLSVTGIAADIAVENLLRSTTIEGLEGSINTLQWESLSWETSGARLDLEHGNYLKSNRILTAGTAAFSSGSLSGKVSNATLGPLRYSKEGIAGAGLLSWLDGNVNLDGMDDLGESTVALSLGNINLGNTVVTMTDSGRRFSGRLTQLRADSLELRPGGKFRYAASNISGDHVLYEMGGAWRFSVEDFHLNHNAASHVSDIRFETQEKDVEWRVEVPSVDLLPRFGSSLLAFHIDSASLKSPKVSLSVSDSGRVGEFKVSPSFHTGPLRASDAAFLLTRKLSKDTLFAGSEGELSIQRLDGAGLLEKVFVNFPSPLFSLGREVKVNARAGLTLWADRIQYDSTGSWTINVDQLTVENSQIRRPKMDASIDLDGLSGQIEKTTIRLPVDKDLLDWVLGEPSFEIRDADLIIPMKDRQLVASGLQYRNKNSTLEVSSVDYVPFSTREEFVTSQPFQKDYISIATGPISVRGLDPRALLQDSTLIAQRIDVMGPQFEVYRDKRRPRQEGTLKALPANMIKSIPWQVDIDTLEIRDSRVSYTEVSEKTLKPGTIVFTNLDARIVNLAGKYEGKNDSLRLNASALLMDTSLVQLTFHQSYFDTLSTFSFRVGMGPYRLQGLNPVVEPLASFRIPSGQADRLQLMASGNEYYTLGKMKFYYQDLVVQFLQPDAGGGSLFTGLSNFFTNSFIINKKNSRKDGVVYFERDRERSIFNYWLKITMSGVLTSVGVKTNKSYMRNYRRNLRKHSLPGPIE